MLRCPFEDFIDDCVYMEYGKYLEDGKFCDGDIEINAGNGDAKCYKTIETLLREPLCLCPLHFGDCEHYNDGKCNSPMV